MSKQKELPPYLESIGRYLGWASGTVNRVTQDRLEPHGLTLQHWVVLTAIWRQEGLTVSDVAMYYRMNRPAASRIISRMVDAGWLRTETDSADKRATRVYLTDKSRDISHLLDIYKDVNSQLLDGFSEAEITQFKQMLTRLARNGSGGGRG